MPLLLRRGTESSLTNIIPNVGEPIWTTDTKKLYVGDGTTYGGILVSGGGSTGTYTTLTVTSTATVGTLKFSSDGIAITSRSELIGPQGPQGPSGPTGQTSNYFEYTAKTNSTSGDPTSGKFEWNNATQTSATALLISHIDGAGDDINVFNHLLNTNCQIIIQDKNNNANYQKFTVTGSITENSTYDTVPVTFVSAGGTGSTGFSNNHSMILIYIIAGQVGPQGPSGPIGYTGSVGATGAQGPQGPSGPQGVQGNIGYTGSAGSAGPSGPGADQSLNTTSSVTFSNLTVTNNLYATEIITTSSQVTVRAYNGFQIAPGTGYNSAMNVDNITGYSGYYVNVNCDLRLQGDLVSRASTSTQSNIGEVGTPFKNLYVNTATINSTIFGANNGTKSITGVTTPASSLLITPATGSPIYFAMKNGATDYPVAITRTGAIYFKDSQRVAPSAGGGLTVQGTGTVYVNGGSSVDSSVVLYTTGASILTNQAGTTPYEWAFNNNGTSLFPASVTVTTTATVGTLIFSGDGTPITSRASLIGPTGPSGPIGYTGSASTVAGPSGPQGNIGYTGSQGSQGAQGNIGYTGSQGAQGSQGNIGYTGSQGSTGAQGPSGPQGNIGYTGSQGTAGNQGNVGYTGSAGTNGTNGATGYTGSQGAQGSQGATGYTGSAGTNGSTGPSGPTGYTGSSGNPFGGGTFTGSVTLKGVNETLYSWGNVAAGTYTPDVSTGTVHKMTLTGNVTISTLANATTGTNATLILTQDATGSRTLTSTMKFAGNSKTLSTTANSIDTISIFYDGTNYYASLVKGYV